MLIVSFSAHGQLMIKGGAPGYKNGTLVSIKQQVPKRLSENSEVSNTIVRDGKFVISLKASGAELYAIEINGRSKSIFLAPGVAEIVLNDSLLRNIVIEGNLTGLAYEKYASDQKSIGLTKDYLRARADFDTYQEQSNLDTVLSNHKMQLRDKLKQFAERYAWERAINYIGANPLSAINSKILHDQIGKMPEYKIDSVFRMLQDPSKKSSWYEDLKYQIDSVFVGGIAANFSQNDRASNKVSLKDFRGSFVLVDFWASWCLPCRKENPYLRAAVKRFGQEKIKIISISLDDERNSWLKAIKDDQMNWINLSDLKGWDNKVAVNYGISSIPGSFLIDPNGEILAKNLRKDELLKVLGELVK